MNEMMSHEECLRKIELPESIEKLHQAITEKFPINDKKFDAWYTNRPYVFQILTKLGQSIAGKLREDLRIEWRKGMPEHLWKLLEAKNTAPKNWEGSPDGALAGIAIILAGWVANQSTAKTRDNPQDPARELFEKNIRPFIIASMDLGIKMAESERKHQDIQI